MVAKSKLEALRAAHTSSTWAIWSPDFPDQGCIESVLRTSDGQLKEDADGDEIYDYILTQREHLKPHIVAMGLNPGRARPSNYMNYHTPMERFNYLKQSIENGGLSGAYMTDLVEEAGTESGEVAPSLEDAEKLLDQLDILDRDEYHVIVFMNKAFSWLANHFEKDYVGLKRNVRYFTTDKNGMRLHFYRVYFYHSRGYNHKYVQQLPGQLHYLGDERIPNVNPQTERSDLA